MKGLLYSSLLHNRGSLIGTAVFALASAALGASALCFTSSNPKIAPIVSMMTVLLPVIAAMIPIEMTDKEFENNLKSRFTNYILSSVTKKCFLCTELVKKLIYSVYSIFLGWFVYGAFFLTDTAVNRAPLCNAEMFVLLPLIALLSQVLEWIVTPFTIVLKSREKGGLLVGLVIGIFIACPISMMAKGKIRFDAAAVTSAEFVIPFLGVSAAIFALFYLILFKMLKRGNIC